MTVFKKAGVVAVIAATAVCVLLAFGLIAPEAVVHREDFLDAAGNSFTGDYLSGQDRYVGAATIVFQDGSVYVGGFAEGHFEGEGHYRAAAGWEEEGLFVKGRLVQPAH